MKVKIKIGKKKEKVKVKIDDSDLWNLDSTLAYIIHPALVRLKELNDGIPFVDNEDVPLELRSEDDHYPKKWDWIMDEMIWVFHTLNTDWSSQFIIEPGEIDFTKYPEDKGKTCTPLRWKKKGVYDTEGKKRYEERINNALRLFGKYFRSLWY